MVTISYVDKSSTAERAGILAGDKLNTINGSAVNDVLDYRFYITERVVVLGIVRGGSEMTFTIHKPEYDDIGLEFETYLMDRKKCCANKCIFCFIDQNPEGMRESIYFKDDDERLSFLQGNYVTLTNLKQRDIDRMIKMRISPINVSVHTVEPELRCRMLGNRFAGDSLKYLSQLADAGIELNLQFVLCRGINDGVHLRKSLDFISTLSSFQSAAFVPAGLTGYRKGLFPLEPYDAKSAAAVIDEIEKENRYYIETRGEGGVFASDEFYLTAKRPLPDDEFYCGYPQLENGVGMLTDLKTTFLLDLDDTEQSEEGEIHVATGEAAYPLICELAEAFSAKFPQRRIVVHAVKNNFFGGSVTVSGLVTATDIIDQLAGKVRNRLIIPSNMLKADEDIFLDNITLSELSARLGVPVRPVRTDETCAAFAE